MTMNVSVFAEEYSIAVGKKTDRLQGEAIRTLDAPWQTRMNVAARACRAEQALYLSPWMSTTDSVDERILPRKISIFDILRWNSFLLFQIYSWNIESSAFLPQSLDKQTSFAHWSTSVNPQVVDGCSIPSDNTSPEGLTKISVESFQPLIMERLKILKAVEQGSTGSSRSLSRRQWRASRTKSTTQSLGREVEAVESQSLSLV